MKNAVFLALMAAVLTACGGGGDGGTNKGATMQSETPATVLPVATGTFGITSASTTPTTATTTAPITVAFDITFTGSVSPAPADASFEVPWTIYKDGAIVNQNGSTSYQDGAVVQSGTATLRRVTGNDANGTYSAQVMATVNGPHAAGQRIFALTINPAQNLTVNGVVPSIAYTYVLVN